MSRSKKTETGKRDQSEKIIRFSNYLRGSLITNTIVISEALGRVGQRDELAEGCYVGGSTALAKLV